MKRKLASAVVVFGLLASSVTPASAVFGLSKCEKVKKQILSYEKKELSLSRTVSSFAGQPAYKFTISQNKSNYLKMKKYVAFEFVYIRFAYNNSKCFTKSQNEFINASYKYNSELQTMFETNPYFLDAWQKMIMGFTYPYGSGGVVSLYSK
jgi:hypothetical protein